MLEELCRQMGITDPQEVQEFALFLIKGDSEPPGLGRKHGQGGFHCCGLEGGSSHAWGWPGHGRGLGGPWAGLGLALVSLFRLGTWTLGAGELVRPLWPQEYLNSVLGGPDVSLHSRRLGWETRLHFDNPTCISTHYGQVSLAR